jgi:glyoxylase-like metal-dependent hydrolase (beta-lactamase superfamily II)
MKVLELSPRLVMLHFPVGHAYLWRGSDGLTLIDTGVPGSAPAIDGALDSLGHRRDDVRRLLLTHHHGDHAGSAAEIRGWGGVTVHAHREEAPVLRGEQPGRAPDLAEWEQELLTRVQAGMPTDPVLPVPVDCELADGDEIDLGGEPAIAVAVPGHTCGSVAFYLPRSRVLFAGDTIARAPDGTVMLGVFNVDPALAAASFRRQAKLDVEIACFGHGEPLTESAADALRAAADQPSGQRR